MNRLIGHLSTITRHKLKVSAAVFPLRPLRAGDPVMICPNTALDRVLRRGALLSRKPFSPIDREKEVLGYSLGWLHHKGRNKHHWEYWLDNGSKNVHPSRWRCRSIMSSRCSATVSLPHRST